MRELYIEPESEYVSTLPIQNKGELEGGRCRDGPKRWIWIGEVSQCFKGRRDTPP